MSLLNSIQEVATTIMANPVCGRLAEVSVELVVVAAVVWAFIRVFRIRSARVCSLLWVLVLAKAALGLAVGSLFNVAAVPLDPPTQANAISTMNPSEMSDEAWMQREIEMRRVMREADAMMSFAMAAGSQVTAGATEVPSAQQSASPAKKQWTAASVGSLVARSLMILWVIGVLWLVGRTLLDLLKIRRLNSNSAAPPEAVLAVFIEEAKRLGIKRGPRLGVCDEIESPALIGFFNASVLVPQWLAESSDQERVRWMLAHELTHWKHKDPAGLFVRRMAQVLLWFHPVVWWAGKRWEEATEYACDRALVENKAQAHDYAEQLYRVLENMSERRLQLSRQTGLFATRTQIGRRIATLLANPLRSSARLSTFSVTALSVLAVVALSCGVGVAWKSPEKESDESESSVELSDMDWRKFSRLTGNFRAIGMGISVYNMNNKKMPTTLNALSTPVAYLQGFFQDPWGEGQVKVDFNPPSAPGMVMLGSVGPDGKWDDFSPITPDNIEMKGDYVRVINPKDGRFVEVDGVNWSPILAEANKRERAHNEKLRLEVQRMNEAERKTADSDVLSKISKADWAKFADANGDFRTMGTALAAYRMEYGKVPAKLSALTTPIGFIMKIPNDPFGKGPIRVNLSPSSAPGMVMLGSVGPDGKWDNFRSIDPDTSGLKGDYIRVINPNTGGFVDVNGANWDPIKAEVQRRQIARDNTKKTDYIKEWSAKSIAARVARVQSDLRTIQTGMETYRIDNKDYPLTLRSLTTPIAYVNRRLPLDPFSKEEIPDTYKMNLNAPEYKPIIYSVGPDGVDQKGKKVYDPAKGEVSPGDIIRMMSTSISRFEDKELEKKIKKQDARLESLRPSITFWFNMNHDRLPKSMKEVTDLNQYLTEVMEDIFVPGRSLTYRLAPDGKTARLYSFGPDGDDDLGEKKITGIIPKGQVPNGDIFIEISLAGLQDDYFDISPFETSGILDRRIIDHLPERYKHMRPLFEDLFDLQEKEKRPNAMLYYAVAGVLSPKRTSLDIGSVLQNGWTKESEVFRPYLQYWQPAFKQIRKAVALDYAKGIGVTRGSATPIANFIDAQYAARALCVEGRWFESQSKYREALENYLAVLTMGRDYASPDGTLIEHLFGIAFMSIADARILELVGSGNLQRVDLDRCSERLAVIEKTKAQIIHAFRNERLSSKARYDEKQSKGQETLKEELKGLAGKLNISPDKMTEFMDMERFAEDSDKVWGSLFKQMETPWWERDRDAFNKEHEALIKRSHPLIQISSPNFLESDARDGVAITWLRQARLAPALEAFKMDQKRYPESMGTLMPRYLDSLIIDPFSGKSILYEPSGDGYKMWSVGPDSKDDSGTIRYDPSNGTVSRGDILFSN